MRLKRLGILLSPSLISGSLVILTSVIILGGAAWSYSVGSGLIYDFLFGPDSSGELIRSSRNSISAFTNTVFGNPTLNRVLYFAFWLLVGLIVYVILYVLIRGTSSAVQDMTEATYTNIKPTDKLKSVGERLAIHLLVAVAWLIYWIFFVKIFLPFAIEAAKLGASSWPHAIGWAYGLLGLIVLVVSLHIHVVFLRLLMLRTRLYVSN